MNFGVIKVPKRNIRKIERRKRIYVLKVSKAKELQNTLMGLWLLKNGNNEDSDLFRQRMSNHRINDQNALGIIQSVLDVGRDGIVRFKNTMAAESSIKVIVKEMLKAGYAKNELPAFLRQYAE